MSFWESLSDAQLADVSFPVKARSFTGGYDFARVRRPYRNGQETDRTGRRPLVFKLVVELCRDVDESHYPDRYQELLDVLTRDSAPIEYADPILGSFGVEVAEYSVDEEAQGIDSATLQITLEEVSSDDFSSSVVPQRLPGSAAIAWALELDTELAEAGVADADVTSAMEAKGVAPKAGESVGAGSVFADTVSTFQARFSVGAAVASEVERAVDVVRLRVGAVMSMPQLGTSKGYPARAAALLLLDSVTGQADRLIARQVPMVDAVLGAASGARELAVKRYGSADLAGELVRRNGGRRPWSYPAGATVRMPLR